MIFLLTHEAVVLFDELSRFAVAVVVHRAAAVVGKVVQFLRQLHGITDARGAVRSVGSR